MMESKADVLPVIRMGHPTLRLTAKPLAKEEITSQEFAKLIKTMYNTMKLHDGVGIAAPQVNISKQVCIIEVPADNPRYGKLPQSPLLVIINPKITVLNAATQGFWEGCLSIPGLRGYVKRPKHVRVDYLDENANEQSIEGKGFMAVVLQHQLDHLFGSLYVDKVEIGKLTYVQEWRQFGLDQSQQVLDD